MLDAFKRPVSKCLSHVICVILSLSKSLEDLGYKNVGDANLFSDLEIYSKKLVQILFRKRDLK